MSENSDTKNVAVVGRRDPREILAVFESAEDLPTLPEVAVRLQEIVDDPRSGAKEVARIIEDDPAIAAKVLKVVNSAFYSPSDGSCITELQLAIARLGLLSVTNIALSTSIFKAFSRAQLPIFDRREFWRHSVCVGIVASVLHDNCAGQVGQIITRDTVHLAGIVHDMGKILFERYANAEFHRAINSAEVVDIPVVKEEARFVGMGHDEAGGWLAAKWKLPENIHAAIRWHHDPLSCPQEEFWPLVKLVHMADYFCHNQQLGQSGNPTPTYDRHIREELGLDSAKINDIMDIVQVEAANSEILLSLT